MTEQHTAERSPWDRRFNWATVFFAVALGLHAADHLRRGMNVVPPAVMVAGMVQIVVASITVALVVAGNRWAPHAAVAIGFASASDGRENGLTAGRQSDTDACRGITNKTVEFGSACHAREIKWGSVP